MHNNDVDHTLNWGRGIEKFFPQKVAVSPKVSPVNKKFVLKVLCF